MIQMRLDVADIEKDNQMNVLNQINQIKRLFNELEVTCPFLPKTQLKRSLELKGKFVVLKLKDAMVNERMNLDQNITEIVEILVEHKKRSISTSPFGTIILNLLKTQENSLIAGKGIESLIPECEEFTDFHIDLLNILTEITLSHAIECKKTLKFSEYVTDAINFNVRSLNLKSNVMGYFEFLKLTKLQEDPRKGGDFEQAIETCLASLKSRVGPNEDIKGKLQIIRLIVNETRNIKKGIAFAIELFANCEAGPMIFEEMICLIEETENGTSFNSLLERFLEKFGDQLRGNERNQKCVLETLLRLAEKNCIIKKDFKRSEDLLRVIQSFDSSNEEIKMKMAKCYLRLDKISEAKAIIADSADCENLLMSLEMYLRIQDEFNATECIEILLDDSNCRHDHFLNLFNLLKVRLSSEIKMKLLKSAQLKMKTSGAVDDPILKVDTTRGILSLLYDGIMESGFTKEFKEEFELNLDDLSSGITLTIDQITWICQVCWNLGVIHARAEDFTNAQLGFKWCQEFAQKSKESKNEFDYKASFYYLTAKLCNDEKIDEEFDYKILSGIDNESLEVNCLKIEMYLRSRKWEDLIVTLKNTFISFEMLAEVVLRSSEEIPLEIYRLVLDKLSEDEFNSDSFDICRFSGLYRGLTTCSLLQYPNDMTHFHSALKMIKSSFGKYPGDEIEWLCGTALEMGRQSAEVNGDWSVAGEWTEIALNLVYLIPVEEEEHKIIKSTLQESIQNLFEKIVSR